uniref:Uncharacterized protein n=1 Tax=Nicotiana tabacum TaxID=4097 RepID=A0A1S4BQ90_TOBAC|nr:PREDICTED: uncharacterized protein LOC107810753 [Nicotiana tabacum]
MSQICFCINDYFPILVFIWFSKKHVIMSMFDVLTPVHSKYCVYIFTTLNNVSCFGSINLWICLLELFLFLLVFVSLTSFDLREFLKDATELDQLISYLINKEDSEGVVLLGHSTGCQDIVYYMRTNAACSRAVRAAILQVIPA